MAVSVIVTLIVIGILFLFTAKGFRKGFLRILFSTFALIITVIIATWLTKPLAEFIQEKTEISESIHGKITEFVDEKFAAKEQEAADSESEFIEKLPLPQFIKDKIKDSNTLTEYRNIGVSSFKEYITAKLTSLSIQAMAFLALAIVTYLLIRILFHLLKVINKIPILRGFNRILGAALGLFEGLLIIWGVCCIIVVFSATEFGTSCMNIIQENAFLRLIYDNNLLLSAVTSVIKMI